MITNAKRGKGKIKGTVSIKDMWKFFKRENPDTKIKYRDYTKAIKLCNKKILYAIVNDAKVFVIPYRQGSLSVIKRNRVYSKEKRKWAVNYQESKKQGFIIYYDQDYLYDWTWNKNKAILINKSKYKFIASREAKRMVKPALESGKDFFAN